MYSSAQHLALAQNLMPHRVLMIHKTIENRPNTKECHFFYIHCIFSQVFFSYGIVSFIAELVNWTGLTLGVRSRFLYLNENFYWTGEQSYF